MEKPWQCNNCENENSCHEFVKKCSKHQRKYLSCARCEELDACKVCNFTTFASENICILLIAWAGIVFEDGGGLH